MLSTWQKMAEMATTHNIIMTTYDDDAPPIHQLTHHQFHKRDMNMMTMGRKRPFLVIGMIFIGSTVRPTSALLLSEAAAVDAISSPTSVAAAEQHAILIIASTTLQLTSSERELSKHRHRRRHESEQHHPSNSKIDGSNNHEKSGGKQQQTPAPTNDSAHEDDASVDIDDDETSQSQQHGQLEEQEHEQTTIDYSIYACDELPNLQQKANTDGDSKTLFNQCEFAMNCNDGDGILFSRFFFCNIDDKSSSSSSSIPASTISSTPHSLLMTTITLLVLLLALLLLFRLLSSTTDEFFSPGLEMFSLRLGLPPRFAGVTLLALGNGAPDVAATMNAMLAGSRGVVVGAGEGNNEGGGREGYGMALGELTGTCMFNICLILGAIVIYLGGDGGRKKKNNDEVEKGGDIAIAVVRGVPCQGPLLRDISVLVLVCVVSMSYLKSGVIDHEFVYAMLGIYVSYVLVVLGADAYHVFYHVPLMADMLRRSTSSGSGLSLDEPTSSDWDKGETGDSSVANEQTPLVALPSHRCERSHRYLRHRNSSSSSVPPHHHHTIRETVIEAISNYSCTEEPVTANPAINGGRADHLHLVEAAALSSLRDDEGGSIIQKEANLGWAPSFEDGNEPLVIFHPNHAVHPHHHHHIHKPSDGPVLFLRSDSSHGHSPSPRKAAVAEDTAAEANKSMDAPPLSTPAAGVVNIECFVSSSLHSSKPLQIKINRPNSWKEAWSSNLQEFIEHWHDFFTDIYFNQENSAWDVVLLSMELPFTIARKLTNPVPCDGYYCRPLVAVSLSLSPIWIWFYFSDQFDVDIFEYNVGYAALITALGLGLIVMRYAPAGEGPMDFYMVIPLTLYGFAVAATWIDSIANKLVEILELFGILLRIPSTILGLTVLAFGNSIQDLVANVTLSKKGLSTMATTACFAGPIFNLCAGLGLGFWALMKSTGREEIHVELPRNIATGFVFAIANCLLIIIAGTVIGKGVIGRGYGYAACGMYTVYVLTSLYI